ncbi:MAG: hypothetical protein PUJ55_16645 [Clostridiales bacterium]|nr:hypothetical protein [Roseburia sp.]MDD7638548.1 hypothetical protein [Clostridiales bacterium]MDY4111449.1 hypothetical protein [Roseburia sp.]
MNTTENPIAIRSKNMLSDALLTLMMQKNYSEISIGELTKKLICQDEPSTDFLIQRTNFSYITSKASGKKRLPCCIQTPTEVINIPVSFIYPFGTRIENWLSYCTETI